MLDSSLLSTFPIEIIHEIIRNSDASTLARWCLVSRAFLAFAGPLLHEIVPLSRSQDVVPFLERLRQNARAQTSNSSSLPFPFLASLRRLEILELPSPKEYRAFINDLEPSENPPTEKVVLALGCWDEEDEEKMADFWVPTLLLFLQPARYEELNRRGSDKNIYFAGEVISFYLQELTQLQLPNSYLGNPGALVLLYETLSGLALVQINLDAGFLALGQIVTKVATLPLAVLSDTLSKFARIITVYGREHSILEDQAGDWDSVSALQAEVTASTARLKEYVDLVPALRDVWEQLTLMVSKKNDSAQTSTIQEDPDELRISDETE